MNTQQRLAAIDRKIQGIKNELLILGEMRPGSLTKQVQVRNGKEYSYWQLSYTHKMRSRTNYVRPDLVKGTRRQVKAFKRFKVLVDAWVELAIKHAQLSTASKIKE
jgi:hypothetical protein